jgi:hypothetical protein
VPVAFVVHHVRSGVAALNVVSAALDVDPRTRDTEVIFAKGREELAAALCGWSFYSTDAPAAYRDLAWVRERTVNRHAMHVAGGGHATAEPLDVLRGGRRDGRHRDARGKGASYGQWRKQVVAAGDLVRRRAGARGRSGSDSL